MVDRFEKFSYSIFEISRCWHKIASDELLKYGLKGSYAVYFTTMYRFDDGITSAKLCELCGRDKADVSRAMSLLEEKGLVTRSAVGGNLYRAKLLLTDKGKRLAEYINRRAQLAVERGGSGLTDAQREVLYSSLELIAANLQSLSKEGLPE